MSHVHFEVFKDRNYPLEGDLNQLIRDHRVTSYLLMHTFLKHTTRGRGDRHSHLFDIVYCGGNKEFVIEAFDSTGMIRLEQYYPDLCQKCMSWYCDAWNRGITCTDCNLEPERKLFCHTSSWCSNLYSKNCLIRQRDLQRIAELKEKWDFSEYCFTLTIEGRHTHTFRPAYMLEFDIDGNENWIKEDTCYGYYYYSWIAPKTKFNDLQSVLPVYPDPCDDRGYEWLCHIGFMDTTPMATIQWILEKAVGLGFKLNVNLLCKECTLDCALRKRGDNSV